MSGGGREAERAMEALAGWERPQQGTVGSAAGGACHVRTPMLANRKP